MVLERDAAIAPDTAWPMGGNSGWDIVYFDLYTIWRGYEQNREALTCGLKVDIGDFPENTPVTRNFRKSRKCTFRIPKYTQVHQ
jgi:hypothetical protein